MPDSERTGLIRHFASGYPARSAVLVAALLLSGLSEGVGIATLLPVLELAVGDAAGGGSTLTRGARALLGAVRLEPTLAALLALIVAALALKGVFRWLAMSQVGYTVARVAGDLRSRLIRALMAARWRYFAAQPIGQFANAVSRDAFWAAFSYRHACAALAGLIQLVVYAAVVVLVSWEVALFAVVVGAAIALTLGGFVRMGRRAGHDQTEVLKTLASRLTDALQGIKPIKAMAREREVVPLLERETERIRRAEERQVLAIESLHSFQEPLVAAVIAIGIYAALTWGEQPFSALILMVFLFHRIVGRFHVVQTEYQGLALAESAFWSLRGLTLAAQREREAAAGGGTAPPLAQGIEFRNVSFAYDGTPVLRDVSFTMATASFTALTGSSGAGKSTIADLILGLLQPDAGVILVDGQLLGGLDPEAWRHAIGYVPQETILFHDTVARNVTLGDDAISRDAVERSLRDAGAWDFVTALSEGMDTVVGERGLKLSGGERQRIALARALVRSPRLLVLDEATADVDPATEAGICRRLRELVGRMTIVAVSHRRAMVEAADVAYEVGGGTVRRVKIAVAG